ncbi:RHS repeat-associated core domain-containing protein, partial [Xanthomonas albilineans]
ANQVTGLAWGKAGQAALGSLGYGYDSRGQLVAQTGSHAPQALPPASTNNTFDDNNRQTQANGNARSYDADGHLLTDGTRTYTWDDRDHLSQITQGGTVIASYSYDALGRRSARTENGTTTQYLYDGVDAVQETQGTTINPILTGPGIDERYARDDNGGRTYFLTDALGSTRLLTDTNGNAVQRYDYDPYGATTQSSTSYSNPYQYTGREHDQSGLYYYRARYYTAELGRFISEDPIKLAGGVNSFAYVYENPVGEVDPRGLWGGGAIVGGSIDAGAVVAGAGATASVGAGIFGGGKCGINDGVFASGGAFAGGPGYGAQYPKYPQGNNMNVAGGDFAGVGAGGFLTNATSVAELSGPFDTWTFNVGVGPLQFSAQFALAGDIWIGSITAGPGAGVSGSSYPTNTWTKGL